ncbi:MAG: sigma-70 family RNA polymerase sigma factor [Anaerolineales bacterium]|nr:sigma-70 family RNA polymerase sigma factor [Anaerolineales bacterium]
MADELGHRDQYTEEQLVGQAVEGDQDAFGKLYDLYVDRIFRFIAYRVGNDPTAEDLTSEVFMKAWDALDDYEPTGAPFGAWLFRIARNTVIDHHRTKKEQVELEKVAPILEDPQADPQGDVLGELELERLKAAMSQLTEAQQEVLTLKFIEGLSTRETAEVLGKKQGAIRALQMRGLHALADLLGIEHD